MSYEPTLHGGTSAFESPVGLTLAGETSADRFDEILADAFIEDAVDYGSFKLYVGFDEHGQVAYFIRPKLRHQLHIVISVPMGPTEFLDRVGA
jgi:hypothetical protein